MRHNAKDFPFFDELFDRFDWGRDWPDILAALVVAVLLVAVTIWPYNRRERQRATAKRALVASRQAIREQEEANRPRGEARETAQTALDNMYRAAMAVIGPEYELLEARFQAALARLGEQDRRRANSFGGRYLTALRHAHAEYRPLTDGRTIAGGGLHVHTDDALASDYTTGRYERIAWNADRVTEIITAAQSAHRGLAAACKRLETAIEGAAAGADDVAARADQVLVTIKARRGEGYETATIRNKISVVRSYITQARTAIADNDFISAVSLVESAERRLGEAQEELEDLPRRRAELDTQALMFEQRTDTVLRTTLLEAEAQLRRLRRRYDRSLFQEVGATLSQGRTASKQLAAQLTTLRAHTAAFELDEAETVAAAIEATLTLITETNDRLEQMRQDFVAALDRFHEEVPRVSAEIKRLIEAVRQRQGTQRYHRSNAVALQAKLEQARNTRRANPVGAMAELNAISERADEIDRLSQAAHRRFTQRQ